MSQSELIGEGERIMTVCNSCRYCEGFCAVFPAMDRRLNFAEADLNYLANLCHNCSECLYACQYAPPHAFAVNVPLTLAKIRLRSYEKYCWPSVLASAFKLHGIKTVVGIAIAMFICLSAATLAFGHRDLVGPGANGNFYSVVPHQMMAGIFGAVFIFVIAAMIISIRSYLKDTGEDAAVASRSGSMLRGLRDAMSLRNLHASGENCTTSENVRRPWRRWFHHLTFYGFLLCFAATSVASVYHFGLHWEAPYPFLSAPVLLGTVGGVGLIIGPLGLRASRVSGDPAVSDSERTGLEDGFIMLLVLTSITGLALLLLRNSNVMGLLLLAHLAVVLTLMLTLPYGKFVHGLYRVAALIRAAREEASPHQLEVLP